MFNVSAVIAAYLIGSLSFAVIVSKYYGMDDPRTYGSGNPGATNVLRSGKKKAAALTLLGDALKGLVAVILARCLQDALNLSDIAIAAVPSPLWSDICGRCFSASKAARAWQLRWAYCWRFLLQRLWFAR